MIGMDNANIVETEWDHGSDLIQEYPFMVFGSPGRSTLRHWFNKEPHITMHTDYHTSSTRFGRLSLVAIMTLLTAHLCPEVWSYIKRERLYGYHD
jgi:nicotinic acid mononucleotide adenylyltransferase